MSHDEHHRDFGDDHSEWLRTTFVRYERPVVAYALRLLRNNIDLARDCAQETFLQLCALPMGTRPDPIEAWLFCTCRYRVIDRIRKEKNVTFSNTSIEPVSDHRIADDPLSDREDQQRLAKELDKLSDRQRQVVLLRLNEGYSYKRIAEHTGLSANAVGVYLHEAIMKLRIALREAPVVDGVSKS